VIANDSNRLANGVVVASARILALRLQVLDRGQQLLSGSRGPADLHGPPSRASEHGLDNLLVLVQGLSASALAALPHLLAQVIEVRQSVEVRLQERGDASKVCLGQGPDPVDELASGQGGSPRAGEWLTGS
jgi:hypothetical protein